MNKNNYLSIVGDDVVEVNKNLYVILKKLPAPLKKFSLNADQVSWYKYFGKILISSKKLTEPDLIHLHSLAKCVDYLIQAETEISKLGYYGGLIQKYVSGATNISAHLTLREKMLKEIDDYSKHFGFSFKDRMKLTENNTMPQQYSLWELEKRAQSS
jgi:hypothetical protein